MILGRWLLFAWSSVLFIFAWYALVAWRDWIVAILALGISIGAYAAGAILFELAVIQRLLVRRDSE